MGLDDLYEFDLVPIDSGAILSIEHWSAVQHKLLHMQPAREARLVGDPPTAIHIVGYGGVEVAPGVMAHVEERVGTALHVVPTIR